jgi:hypothetical protein
MKGDAFSAHRHSTTGGRLFAHDNPHLSDVDVHPDFQDILMN